MTAGIDTCAKIITHIAFALEIGTLNENGVRANERTDRKEIVGGGQGRSVETGRECGCAISRNGSHRAIRLPCRYRRHLSSTHKLATLNVGTEFVTNQGLATGVGIDRVDT